MMLSQTAVFQPAVFAQEPETTAAVEQAGVQLQDGTALIPANADDAAVKQALFDALVVNKEAVTKPQSLEWEYYCTGKNGLLTTDAWGSINGFTSEKKVVFVPTTFTHPALKDNADGSYKVRLAGTTAEVTLTKAAKPSSSITLKEGGTAALVYNDDMSVNYDALRETIFNAVVDSTTPELTLADVTIEYYATPTTGSAGNVGKVWMPLEGGKNTGLTYPAISAGSQKVRISWDGNQQYAPTTVEVTVQVADREQLQFNLNEAPYEVGMVYDAQQGYDYAATAAAIRSAVIDSTTPDIDLAEITVEYNADSTGITDSFKPLDYTGLGGLVKFGTGNWEIRLSWDGNRGNSVVVNVTTTDNRAASTVVCKTGAAFTYNMDANAMK